MREWEMNQILENRDFICSISYIKGKLYLKIESSRKENMV